jgi:hypothetical protein
MICARKDCQPSKKVDKIMILQSTLGHPTSGIMSGSLREKATGRF